MKDCSPKVILTVLNTQLMNVIDRNQTGACLTGQLEFCSQRDKVLCYASEMQDELRGKSSVPFSSSEQKRCTPCLPPHSSFKQDTFNSKSSLNYRNLLPNEKRVPTCCCFSQRFCNVTFSTHSFGQSLDPKTSWILLIRYAWWLLAIA